MMHLLRAIIRWVNVQSVATDEDRMESNASMKLFVALAVALAGCSPNAGEQTTHYSQAEYAEVGDSFILSKNEIAARETASAAGTAEASYELFMHYAFSNPTSENKENGARWLSKAAQQGHEKAKALLAKK